MLSHVVEESAGLLSRADLAARFWVPQRKVTGGDTWHENCIRAVELQRYRLDFGALLGDFATVSARVAEE